MVEGNSVAIQLQLSSGGQKALRPLTLADFDSLLQNFKHAGIFGVW